MENGIDIPNVHTLVVPNPNPNPNPNLNPNPTPCPNPSPNPNPKQVNTLVVQNSHLFGLAQVKRTRTVYYPQPVRKPNSKP
jgi:hypothetical protein